MNDVLALRLRVIEDRLKALEDRPYAVPGEVVSLPDPEPVPQWRQMVGQAAGRMDAWMLPTPLGTVLDILSYLEMYPRPIDDIIRLSRLVALCEAQVGDGWQADPSGWDEGPQVNIHTLLVYASMGDLGWVQIANAAAAWLRDLTEDDA